MAKTKVFIDADSIITPRPSGIGSMTVQLIRALSEDVSFTERHAIVLVVPFNKVPLAEQWKFNQHVSIRRVPLTGRIMRGLLKLHLLPPLDLLLGKGVYLFPNFRNWPLLFSRSVTYIHDVSFRVFPEYVEKKNLDFLTKNVSTWMNRTDVVVTVSEHARQEIVRYYPETRDKVRIVHNGITPAYTPLTQKQVEKTLASYDLSYKEYFIFLSNLEPRKNISGLLEAYKKFVEQPSCETVRLILVGGMGWNNEAILAEIEAINKNGTKVIVPDHYVPDEELPALLSGAAALVHPAHYEGFGISPLQAMACGTQVVVADNTSLPEVVGDGGFYVKDDDPRDILKGMESAYNRRHESNSKGIKRARKFGWKQSAEQLSVIITELEDKE